MFIAKDRTERSPRRRFLRQGLFASLTGLFGVVRQAAQGQAAIPSVPAPVPPNSATPGADVW